MRKYPNPYATHVHSVDTLSRTMDTETGVIRTERIIGVQQGAPKWITKVRGDLYQSCSFPAVTTKLTAALQPPRDGVRARSRLLRPRGRRRAQRDVHVDEPEPGAIRVSLAYCKLLPSSCPVNPADPRSCLEYITYTPYPSGQGAEAPATLFRQRALMLSQFPTAMIARRIEKASVERFSSNADIGRKGFDWVLETGWKRELRWSC